MGVLMEQLLLYLYLKERENEEKWNDKRHVCVSLVKGVLDTFLVHKIRQIGAKFSKRSFKPLSLGVEAEDIRKDRLLSARSPLW